MQAIAKLVGVLTIAVASVAGHAADIKVIHAGELLAEPGKAAKKKQTIVVENSKIKEVVAGFVDPAKYGADATLVDLSNSFVMPGLMDMHVHLQMEIGPDNDKEALRLSSADMGMKSVMYAKKTLMAGFTTVRDLGADPVQIYALRDAINKGWVDGPRIVASAGVAATGGHGDVDGMRHDLMEKYTSKTICDGPYDCRRAVRHGIKYGADVIKITSTGGVMSDTNTGTAQQMTDDELKEIMDTAHSLGRKVAAHAHAADGINAALRAGVDSIEHGSYANKESIRLFKKTGAYLVPTLLAGDTVVHMAKNSNILTENTKKKALRVGADMMKNTSVAIKAGVKVAYGTDSGVSKHGTNAEEAILMEKAGMSPMDVLKSATVHTADLLDMSDSIGTIEVGKYADIIATDGSALADLKELLDVDFVMKNGQVYKNK